MTMKKFTAALLCVMLVICTSVTAFGATKNDVKEKTETAVAFAFDGNYNKQGYDVTASKNFYILVSTGADVRAYADAYFASVETAAKSGTLADVGTVGLAISIADMLGRDARDINGVDLVEILQNTPVENNGGTPYNYAYAIEAAHNHALDATETALYKKLLSYYKMGEGTDFWGGYGTSPDDLGMFLVALSFNASKYENYINDAVRILETFYTADGYSNYGANADSTALALAAYSALDSKEKADFVYDLLINKFYSAETGGFISDYDEYYATADALFAFKYYLPLADNNKDENESTTAPESTVKADETTAAQNGDTGKTSPDTGAAGITAAAVCAAISLCAASALKKKNK